MSKKIPSLILDECLFQTYDTKSHSQRHITSEKYRKYCEDVEEIIESNNSQYIEDQQRVACIVIDSNNSSSSKAKLFEIVDSVRDENADSSVFEVLITSTIETLPYDDPQIGTVDMRNFDNPYSIKPYNILFNLNKCIDLIAASYGIISSTQSHLAYVLSVLKFISVVRRAARIELSKNEAVILSIIHSLGGSATKDQIANKIRKEQLLNKTTDSMGNTSQLQKSLDKLEKIGTVKQIDGRYTMVEKIKF